MLNKRAFSEVLLLFSEEKSMKNYTLITGASSGIGYQMAKIYAQKGENLILVARRGNILREIQQNFPNIEVIEMDLSVPENAKKIFHITQEKGLFVSRLINNAGVGVFGDFTQTDLEKEVAMVNLNIQSLLILTKLFVQEMKRHNRGEILNVGSVAGFMPGPQMSVYYATKSFVVSFSKALSYELRHTNIKVSVLAPGATQTEFEQTANLQNSMLFKRFKAQTAEEVAQYAVKNLGKRVIIPKFLNRLLVLGSRLSPDFLLLPIVAYLQKKKQMP